MDDDENYITICTSCHRAASAGCACRAFRHRDQDELAEIYSNDTYYKDDDYKHVD